MLWTAERLTTPRLVLRPPTGADTERLVELMTDPRVRRYLGGPADPEVVEALRRATVGERWGVWAVTLVGDDTLVGVVSLDRGRGELEVSYEMHPSVWGRGLATEAVGAVLEWVWRTTDDPSVIAVTQTANLASRRLLARLGFTEVEEFEEWDEPQTLARLTRPS